MLDMSGSMLGQRYEIAKQTTEAILETLSHNDYFNIMPVGVLLLLLLSRPPSVLQVGLLPGRLCRRARPAPSHHEEQEAAAVEDEQRDERGQGRVREGLADGIYQSPECEWPDPSPLASSFVRLSVRVPSNLASDSPHTPKSPVFVA